MGIKAKRDAVLGILYDDLSGILDEEERKNVAEAIKIVEDARVKERELELKMAVTDAELESKKSEQELADRELRLKEEKFLLEDRIAMQEAESKKAEQERERKLKTLDLVVKIGSTILWGALFAHEMHATRLFETTGTEVSNASRWLKQAFPKVRLI